MKQSHRSIIVIRSDLSVFASHYHHDFIPYEVLWVSDIIEPLVPTINYKQALNKLGQEADFVVFDMNQTLSVNALGAVSGCIRGSGALVLLLPEGDEHYKLSFFYQRMLRVLSEYKVAIQRLTEFSVDLLLGDKPPIAPSKIEVIATPDQVQVIEDIKKVVTGHRNRPLVITANRGRGKSSAIGLAIKVLFLERQIKIIVCAPSRAMVAPLLHCAGRQADLHYIPVDELVRDLPEAGLLVIDEAGAIPVPLLSTLLQHYSRLVFSTTLHGYEGNGRGFAIRFNKQLDQYTPDWRSTQLKKPIRWKENDPLEALINKILLLESEPEAPAKQLKTTPNTLVYKVLNASELLANETLLQQLFGLLVVAHYQTRPSDLLQILDSSQISIHTIFNGKQLIATAIINHEGDLDAELANAIYRGERRPKGHLVPQILLSQMGLIEAATLTTHRIMRIATHPSWRRQGVASRLLKEIERNSQADYLSTSFGLSSELQKFWIKSHYNPIYLGLKHEASSGYHSAVFLNSLNEKGDILQKVAAEYFARNFKAQLGDAFKNLNPLIAYQLLRNSVSNKTSLSQHEIRDIKRFTSGQCGLDSALAALQNWLPVVLNDDKKTISNNEAKLLVMRIFQHHSWPHCCERLGIAGKKSAQQKLQQTVSVLANTLAEADLSKDGLTRD